MFTYLTHAYVLIVILSTLCVFFQLLSSLRVILTLPPLTSTTTSHKAIRDIHRQVASGLLELLQAHSSDLHTPNEWSVVFSVMEFAGTGLILYENKEDIASSSPINLETVSVDTGFQDGSVVATESSSVPCEEDGIQSDSLDALYSKVGRIFDKEAAARLLSEWNAFIGRADSARKVNVPKTEEAREKVYCPEVDQDNATSGRPGSDGCSLLWHVAWCPILQGTSFDTH